MNDAVIGGVALSPSVVETIAGIAIHDLKEVYCVGSSDFSLFKSDSPIYAYTEDDKTLNVVVHVTVMSDVNVENVAKKIRTTVASSVYIQTGIEVKSVDVYVDGVEYAG